MEEDFLAIMCCEEVSRTRFRKENRDQKPRYVKGLRRTMHIQEEMKRKTYFQTTSIISCKKYSFFIFYWPRKVKSYYCGKGFTKDMGSVIIIICDNEKISIENPYYDVKSIYVTDNGHIFTRGYSWCEDGTYSGFTPVKQEIVLINGKFILEYVYG